MKSIYLLASLLVATLGISAISRAQSPLVVPSAAFRGETGYGYAYDSADGFVWAGQSSNPGCLVAPVVLDDGIEITQLSADLYDNLGFDFTLQLRRHSILGASPNADVIAEVTSNGASTSIARKTDTSIVYGSVDNSTYAYYLTTDASCMAADDTGHRIYGARISFVEPIFADGFETGDTSQWGGSPSSFHLITIPAAGFFTRQIRGFSSGFYIFDSDSAYYRSDIAGFTRCHVSPVELPDGATLWWIRTFLYDNHPSLNLTIELRRKAFKTTAAATVISSVATSGATTNVVSDLAGISQPIIVNGTYTYYLLACMEGSDDLRIYGVNLGYTE